jgi:hypothetical protein
LTIEEFGQTIKIVKESHNAIADGLSRLDTDVSSTTASSEKSAERYEATNNKSLQQLDYQLSTQIITQHRKKMKLIMTLSLSPLMDMKSYFYMILRNSNLSWYHTTLQHPGIQQIKQALCSHLVWPGLSKDVEKYIKFCHQ